MFGKEKIGINIADGIDELSLALTADAWSRTYRSKAYTVSASQSVRSLHGIEIFPDFQFGSKQKFDLSIQLSESPGSALPDVLNQIKDHYGASTAAIVALQLEFPWQDKFGIPVRIPPHGPSHSIGSRSSRKFSKGNSLYSSALVRRGRKIASSQMASCNFTLSSLQALEDSRAQNNL